MQQVTMKILDEDGVHMRPAKDYITLVSPYHSQVHLYKNNISYDARSLLQILKASINKGDIITVVIEGDDEDIVFDHTMEFLLNFSKIIDNNL